ncbi:uncharacterized protein LOC111617728 [Centruroides sculpturatus]|uniref:uncharacterized protein LOC111617728 n=1 Tax=Centruroides sculpturatus TaxID=218467 RepID=UPI000C6DE61A|nr:uncharacterized protein LOC111617728 [Centruroides sculpturatus]XP_023214784.1 uncharacterized protein LOC111617728 [Centruroides sculpturatus]
MKLCILLISGVIACNLGAINGFRMKRDMLDYCGLPVKLQNTILNCIQSQLSFKERQTYSDIARCFNKDNFIDLMTKLCGKTKEEIDAMVELHEDCLEKVDSYDELNEVVIDEVEVAKCVQNNFSKKKIDVYDS